MSVDLRDNPARDWMLREPVIALAKDPTCGAALAQGLRPLTLRERLNVSRLALSHERITVAIWLAVVICGLAAAWRLPLAMFPDIVFPVVVVVADAPGLGVESVEREITLPIEQRLLAIPGRSPLALTTVAGQAVATVRFEVGISLAEAEQRVRAALKGLVLPERTRWEIRPVDVNEVPVVTYAVAPSDPARFGAAVQFAGALARKLRAAPGVARVVPLGLDATRDAAESGDGIGAPAAVAPTRVRLDGKEALALEVVKLAGSNTLEVDQALGQVVRDAGAGGTLQVVPVRAEAPFIREATRSTLEALLAAVVLSVLVIYPFLRSMPATAIAALAIPTSLVGTFLAMALAGFKFETITLLALALVIGIIIDDAIVDVENIARHLTRLQDPRDAARRATDEIGLTVTAATLTIVAVFVPVGLMGGVVGSFFRPFGLTISAAVLTSLLVARTLTPVLAARWLKPEPHRGDSALWQHSCSGYRRFLTLALRHPLIVLLVALLSLAGGIALVPLIPQGFIPALDRGACEVRFALAPGSGVDASDAAAARLTSRVDADPDVAGVLSIAGTTAGDPDSGVLYVSLRKDRRSTTQQVQARLRAVLATEPNVRVSVANLPIIAVAAPQPLEITLTSEDAAALATAARRVLAQVAQWPGVADAAIVGIGPAGDGTWLRREGHPAAQIRANLSGGAALGAVGARVQTEIARLLPPGVSLGLAGESAQAADVFGHFASALGFACAGVVLVLFLLFRSWQDPLAIAIALPLSAVGAMLGLFIAHSDFGIVSLLGLVFLTGLASKNAIILVDRINQLRAAGMERDTAIVESGSVRLRPIAMTTAAAVLGMLPIAVGLGAGAELRAPMAVAIIGGLLTSTLLSLVVVPVAYQQLDRLWPRFVPLGERG